MLFQTKKIKLETLPEYLKEIRQVLKMPIKDVANEIGISAKILENLESGIYDALPSEVYVKGILNRLAALYGVDKQPLLRQFEIERSIHKHIQQKDILKTTSNSGFFKGLIITPKIISIFAVIAFAGVTIVYIIWQVFSIGKEPFLVIYNPVDLTVIEKSAVELIGKTDPGASVDINGETVFVDKDGNFSVNLSLSSGSKVIIITARNRFDRSTVKTITVIGANQGQDFKQNKVVLDLQFTDEVTVNYKIDGNEAIVSDFSAEQTLKLEATKIILISTSNAGAIRAKLNNRDIGFLGRQGEKLVDIPFSAE